MGAQAICRIPSKHIQGSCIGYIQCNEKSVYLSQTPVLPDRSERGSQAMWSMEEE